MNKTPILYSLQNCPYAIRARIALFKSEQKVLIRAVKLNNKPTQMLITSPKGSVPILVVETHDDSTVMIIEESLEIMLWALSQRDEHNLLRSDQPSALVEMVNIITRFESDFIPAYNAYSCAKRYHEDNLVECRQACEVYLQSLEAKLTQHAFLFAEQESLVDIAFLPFLRKFARIEKQWFRQSPYPKLQAWLNHYLQSRMFSKVMEKHELWLDNHKDIYFG
ncbi:glutathione-S-transferase domain-containing protein [Vibrio ichthyoenteri ATCC 700023]|uniref:Glutathione-S-transferase domain-containing protein n=1 Tax=Vibrio ichthyoenteri ATCC 700023 TaxID=870968 RepID=F9RYM1_9VIBR|nr:glutathione S-transferase [Vibrio ichthyoenteri]EGU46438.1 glutathione-S-transferase domain-containing protein [Vibrio ichthyoenteri ATCC 700023]